MVENVLELPPNFQEQMVNCELEFQSQMNETNIRKLIYVYTLGMQYYNLQEKDEFENYYRNKLNNLLLNESVIEYLDSHKVDLSKKVELNLFPTANPSGGNNDSGKSKNTGLKKNPTGFRDDTELKRRPSEVYKKKHKIKKEDIIEYINRKIKEVDIKLVSIDKQVSDNIVEQMSQFESNKRNKKVKKSENILEVE